jgi:predicted alpha/beta hydrolase
VLDFRGHGASVPPRAGRGPHGDWSFDDYVREDVPAAIAVVAAAAGVSPGDLCYIGHSLGGLAGLAAFATGAAPAPRRLVLAAVNVWTHVRGRRRAASLAFTSIARLAGRAPARALRFGTDDEPASYVRQHATWTRGTWRSLAGVDYSAALPSLAVPTLALTADGDWMCTPRDVREFLAPLAPYALLECIGTLRGHPFNPNHFQLLTDPRLTPAWTQVADFCR